MKKTRIAIIGLGMAVVPHAKSALDLADEVEVAYAFSPSARRRAQFAQKFPFPQCDSLETILGDASINAVVVLTPPNTHLDIVRRCAAAGKHVLLEKPLEITTARAEEMVLALSSGRRRARRGPAASPQAGGRAPGRNHEEWRTGYAGGRVGQRAAMAAAELLRRARGAGTRARDGGGVLITQAIHTLDVLLSLAGDPSEVMAFAATTPVHTMESEDIVCAAVRWHSGAYGVIEATTAAYPGAAERIELIGSRGTATLLGTAFEAKWQDGRSETFAADVFVWRHGSGPHGLSP